MISRSLVLLATLFSAAYARVLNERTSASTVTLKIALAQNDFVGLEKALYAASTPGNAAYGKYLTKSEVASYTTPSEETLSRVKSWLSSQGLTGSPSSLSGDWITVNATVDQANQLFQSEPSSEARDIISSAYTIPPELQGYVVAVHPLVSIPTPSRQADIPSYWTDKRGASARSTSSDIISELPESCLRELEDESSENFVKPYSVRCRLDLYDIPWTQATQPREENNLWLVNYERGSLNEGPLRSYLAEWRPDIEIQDPIFETVLTAGGANEQSPDYNLFTDPGAWSATSVAPNVPLTWHAVGTEGATDEISMFLNQANHLLDMENPPKVVVFPYSNKEGLYSRELAQSLCNTYAQLAARGVALIMPLGIGGVEGQFPTGQCDAFDVTFPASCPYVTSVGSTTVSNGVAELPPTDVFANPGGFSSYFARPAYQEAAISTYLDSLQDVTYEHMYNASGRANPDVSMHALISPSVNAGFGIGSPSFAASLFAGVIALLNDELVAAGKPTLGFLNPWIYQNLDAFRDLTEGNSEGCGTPGFNATVGWDPVTGAGVPMYPKLKVAAGL